MSDLQEDEEVRELVALLTLAMNVGDAEEAQKLHEELERRGFDVRYSVECEMTLKERR